MRAEHIFLDSGAPGWWRRSFLTSAVFFLLLISAFAEGTRQLEPTDPATTTNRRTRIMFDQTGGTSHRTPFATIGCQERYRLNVYIADTATEKIYFGFNDGVNTLYYQIKDPDGAIVSGFSLAQVPANGAGFITSWNQAYMGPKIGSINPNGYEPKILSPTKTGNYYIEFAPSATGGSFSSGKDMLYFDISVVRDTNVINGRVWSKAWQLSDDASGDVVKSYPSKLFVYTDDGIVTSLNINEWNGGTYTVYCNQWGVTNTNNWATDRMSDDTWPGTDLPQYKIFLNNPDINIFPTGQLGHICELSSHSYCNGYIDILAKVNKPGSLTLNLDIAPTGPGPEDVVLTGEVDGSANCDVWDTITWNGLDGTGSPVLNGTTVTIDVDYLNGLTNLPLWDVEDNASGLIVNIVRPAPAFNNKLPIYWDDSNLSGGTVNDVDGCVYPTSISVSGCHSWNDQNEDMINTWWYFSEGETDIDIVVLRNPEAEFTFSNNCFGAPTAFTDQSITPGSYPVAWHWGFGTFGDTSNLQNPVYTFAESGSHSVLLRVTANTGCVGQIIKPVVILTAPVAYAGEDQMIQYNTSTTLQGGASAGSGNFSFHWEPASLLVNPNVENPATVNLGETTDFTLTVTDLANGCQHSDVVKVTIIGGPLAAHISADPDAICRGGTAAINAQVSGGSGTYMFTWLSDPPGFSSNLEDVVVQPEFTTTYTLVIADGVGNLTRSVTITVYPDPSATAGSPQTIPFGTYTTLSGSASSGQAPYSYAWSPASMVVSPGQSSTQTALLSSTTNFNLTVNDANGCVATAEVLITVTGGALMAHPMATRSPICKEESTRLIPIAEGGSGTYTYSWTAPGGFQSTDPEPVVFPSQTTTYHLVLNDGYTQYSGDVTVTVNPLPMLNLIPAGAHIYQGDTILACVFDTLVLSAEAPNQSYLWTNGATTAEILAGTTGIAFDILTYGVDVVNTLTGCSNSASVTIMFTYGECSYSVEENATGLLDVIVYPNPGNGVFICAYPPGGAVQMEIFNPLGMLIRKLECAGIITGHGIAEIDLLNQPPGFYLLKVTQDGRTRTVKLIKNEN